MYTVTVQVSRLFQKSFPIDLQYTVQASIETLVLHCKQLLTNSEVFTGKSQTNTLRY